MNTLSINDYHFAAAHGGYSYNPATETAEQGQVRSRLWLARAMYGYRHDPNAYVEWTQSDFPWDGDVPYDGPLLDAALLVADCSGAERCVGSLGCIAVLEGESDPYCRVVEGELYGEWREELALKREAAIVRGEN